MSQKQEESPKPFLKWVGGKKQLLEYIRRYFPGNRPIKKYCEPFIGGGAVFFDMVSQHSVSEVYLSDTNAELVNAYKVVQSEVEQLITKLQHMQDTYLNFDDKERSVFYYQQREAFNSLKAQGNRVDKLNRASLLLFLNRTCFNGLYRENTKGMFNVPMGRYKNPIICDAENLRRASSVLQNATIHQGDFADAGVFIDAETFVYFDPPYRPLSATSSFTAYQKGGFGDTEQIRLAEFVRAVHDKGAAFLLSNSDPRNTQPNDSFFDDLYWGFHVERVPAKRMINSKAGGRGTINEIIVTNVDSGML